MAGGWVCVGGSVYLQVGRVSFRQSYRGRVPEAPAVDHVGYVGASPAVPARSFDRRDRIQLVVADLATGRFHVAAARDPR